ncbi:hypothetical protein PPL_07781 [Heterostelium album PN500]|uniref:Uncharacterized protein n=1 Tax=Heterostelium pallidum (strain ATCC 26659 / Pp 5 / PN500) TaxID=670386 RepID=D3BGX9_HETP5|nr:hypothetical protein PPL_07781 [Heterostelium album PN500]EFA79363.1 hypothetical protein PPL_07781 [Heterostelium album PN500]|eukprot:XP_020431484.1 hypothetical protein PPL_07781 [Heterostelium album PN500]
MSTTFSNIILDFIFSFIKEPIDRASFILTCKRYYNERDCYCNYFKKIDRSRSTSQKQPDSDNYDKKSLSTFSMSPVMCTLIFHRDNFDRCISEIKEEHTILSINGVCEYGYLSIPPSIETLRINTLGESIPAGKIPLTIKKLQLETTFKKPSLGPNYLPDTLESLKLSRYRHSLKAGDLPCYLKELDLGTVLTQEFIDGNDIFPKSLVKLKMSMASKQIPSVKWLPSNLQYLRVGEQLQSTLNMSFPAGLQQLHFPKQSSFNSDLDLSNMSNLTHLSLPINYSSKVTYPPSLKQLKCGKRYLDIQCTATKDHKHSFESIILFNEKYEFNLIQLTTSDINEIQYLLIMKNNHPKLYFSSNKVLFL